MTRRIACAGLTLLFGCSDAHPAAPLGQSSNTERAAVVGGERSGPGIEDAVLLLHGNVEGRELICSASLVAKNLVVTARHCVSHLTEGLFSCSAQGELIEAEPNAGRLGAHFPASTFEFFGGRTPHDAPLARGKQVLSTLSETICTNDIAFVVLDREVDLPVLPLRLDSRAMRGEAVTLIGYGLDQTMDPRDPFDLRFQERTRKADLTIAAVGPDTAAEATSTPPRMIVLDGPSGCLGDSGGPLIASDTRAVLGIYSLLDGETCVGSNLRHLFGHLPSFRALIDQAFAAAGATPALERTPGSGAGGEAGTGGDAGAGTGEGEGGAGGTAEGSAGDGGQAPVFPSEGGEGGAAEPSAGGNAGAALPAVPGTKRASGGCSLAPETHSSWFAAFWVLFTLGACRMRKRWLSAGCPTDLLRASVVRGR
jgi:hypothetical protein